MTSGTNRAGRHAVPLGGTRCCPMPGLGDRPGEQSLLFPGWPALSLALCGVMLPLPPHSPPSNPLSRPHAQRRVESTGANIFIGEARINTSFMSTLKFQNLAGKAIGKARRLPFNIGWPKCPDQIGMQKGGVDRESLDFLVYHGAETQAAGTLPSPISMGLENSVAPTGPWRDAGRPELGCPLLGYLILSPQGHRCSSPHHQCSHLSMTPRSQGLPAALAPQTGSVPISAQRHHLLSKIDRFLTSGAQ